MKLVTTFYKKKFIICFFLLIFSVQFFQVIYFNKNAFIEKYDTAYWKDRYEHSQWQLPLSERIIGDDGLYAYAGYKLVHGLDPTIISAEVPPVGKYIFGFSIH